MKIWKVGDIHPKYGEVQSVGTGGEKYRWFVKDNMVSMIPLDFLEPQGDNLDSFKITGSGHGQSAANKKNTMFVQVNGNEWMTVRECSKKVPPNAEGKKLTYNAMRERIKKYGPLDPWCVCPQSTGKLNVGPRAGLTEIIKETKYNSVPGPTRSAKLDAIPVGKYDNI